MLDRFITPGPLPSANQAELLIILAEECNEAAARASKALRFGLNEVQPGQNATNAERIGHELQDVATLVSACVEAGILSVDLEEPEARRKKLQKLYRFCQREENRALAERLLALLPQTGEGGTDHAKVEPVLAEEAARIGLVARSEVERLQDTLERERSQVATGIGAVKEAIRKREWLRLGRGSFEWDDERWKDEFGHAIDEILEAMEPLRSIACDWSDCPTDRERIKRARATLGQLSTRALGVVRNHDNPQAVTVVFRSEPTDDDIRQLHRALSKREDG